MKITKGYELLTTFATKKTLSYIFDTLHKKFTGDLVTFTEEILNGKRHFLCSDSLLISSLIAGSR